MADGQLPIHLKNAVADDEALGPEGDGGRCKPTSQDRVKPGLGTLQIKNLSVEIINTEGPRWTRTGIVALLTIPGGDQKRIQLGLELVKLVGGADLPRVIESMLPQGLAVQHEEGRRGLHTGLKVGADNRVTRLGGDA